MGAWMSKGQLNGDGLPKPLSSLQPPLTYATQFLLEKGKNMSLEGNIQPCLIGSQMKTALSQIMLF